MSHNDMPAYGLWGVAAVNAAIFILFAFSFLKPQTPRDWRSFSAFSAFLVALFAEMYGFLLQWPTLLTLAMFPVLVVMYVRLARHEEQDALREYGDEYRRYLARVPGFFAHSWRGFSMRKVSATEGGIGSVATSAVPILATIRSTSGKRLSRASSAACIWIA